MGIAAASAAVFDTVHSAVGHDVELVQVGRSEILETVTMDLVLVPAGTEWAAVASFAAIGTSVAIVAERRDDAEEYAAIERGAIAFISLDAPVAAVRRAILAALGGEAVFGRKILGRWLRAHRHHVPMSSGGSPSLSSRQQLMLLMVADGATNEEIAARLRLSPGEVDARISDLLRRIGMPKRSSRIRAASSPLRIEQARDQRA